LQSCSWAMISSVLSNEAHCVNIFWCVHVARTPAK
jgi:hypothetical protein